MSPADPGIETRPDDYGVPFVAHRSVLHANLLRDLDNHPSRMLTTRLGGQHEVDQKDLGVVMIRGSVLFLLFAVAGAPAALAADEASSLGSVWTIHVEAKDSAQYIDYLKSHQDLFENTGASSAGYCLVRAGQSYPGQIFVWSFYGNFEEALTATAKNTLDPKAAKELAKLRELKYTAGWQVLKSFDLAPGYERVWRLTVAPENLQEFIGLLGQMEKAAQANGHPNVQFAAFAPVGGGPIEAGKIMIRAIAATPADLGKYIDDVNTQPKWARKIGSKALSLIAGLSDDTIESCEQIYTPAAQ